MVCHQVTTRAQTAISNTDGASRTHCTALDANDATDLPNARNSSSLIIPCRGIGVFCRSAKPCALGLRCREFVRGIVGGLARSARSCCDQREHQQIAFSSDLLIGHRSCYCNRRGHGDTCAT